MSTADRAEAYLHRQSLYRRLVALFAEHQPSREECQQVSTTTEVAIDRVFAERRLSAHEQAATHPLVKDYAECAALYGYMIGYSAALQAVRGQQGEQVA